MIETMFLFLVGEMRQLRSRLRELNLDDRGSPTVETVLIAGGLAALAIAAVAIILVKVMSVAHHIPTH